MPSHYRLTFNLDHDRRFLLITYGNLRIEDSEAGHTGDFVGVQRLNLVRSGASEETHPHTYCDPRHKRSSKRLPAQAIIIEKFSIW